MSRKLGKSRAAAGQAFSSGTGGFGAFSSISTSSKLSYLSEAPDYSSISDANVVVSFKNLSKRDGTTKSKALEDLRAYTESHPYEQDGGVEEPILTAWVQLYPRVSIDNSRRVRELSHMLQLALMNSAKKRMEKHLPQIVATWLAGTFDRDRAVSRVATEGLSSFLPTPEKLDHFWKRCQPQILDYASESVLETAETLSDERSTSPDDADAKYYRVLSGSFSLALSLLQKRDAAELKKHHYIYNKFLETDKVWMSVLLPDATVRRLSSQLLVICLEQQPDFIADKIRLLSKIYVSEGLKSIQSGSAADFTRALTVLTKAHPTIWTSDYQGKKPPSSRLRGFLEKGSQGSAVVFWEHLGMLLQTVPISVLPNDLQESLDFMKFMRTGISSREEPRSHALDAWTSYLGTGRHLIQRLAAGEERIKFTEEAFFPLTQQYLFPSPERSTWGSGCQIPVLIKAYTSTALSPDSAVVQASKQEWERLRAELSSRIRSSLPGASKEHDKSQRTIAEEGSRWFTLAGKILDGHTKSSGTSRPIPDIPREPSLALLVEAFEILEIRNWKPFGAAAIVEASMKHCGMLFEANTAVVMDVLGHLERAIPNNKDMLLSSPSVLYIVSCINLLSDIPARAEDFARIWELAVHALLADLSNPEALSTLAKLFSTSSAPIARRIPALQQELVDIALGCVKDAAEAEWTVFSAAVNFDILEEATERRLIHELVTVLSKQETPTVIQSLLLIAQRKPTLLSQDDDIHMSLTTRLLSLSERQHAEPEVKTLWNLLNNSSTGTSNFVDLIQQNINDANPASLAIDTLVSQVLEVQRSGSNSSESSFALKSILPDCDIWKRELLALVDEQPNPSLSITSSLEGAHFLVSQTPANPRNSPKRDRTGASIPGRMALYTSKCIGSGVQLGSLPLDTQVGIYAHLGVTAELASDQLTVLGNDGVWKTIASEDIRTEVDAIIASSRQALSSIVEDASGWKDGTGTTSSRLACEIIKNLLQDCRSLTPLGLYCARVLGGFLQLLADRHGLPSNAENWLTQLDIFKSSPETVLPAMAIMTGLGETLAVSRTVSNFCNRLVSDAAGANGKSDKSLATLVLLNASLRVYEVGELPVASNRLVFAVRQITSWLESPEEVDFRFAAEACRSLRLLLPSLKDIYGPYWERSVDFCLFLWTKNTQKPLDERLSSIHASLRLIAMLQSLEEPNDDLVEVLQSSAEKRSFALIGLLHIDRERASQPLEIVDAMICRQVEKIPLDQITDLSDLYGLVASESRAIQTAAFTVLHKAIPASQAELSVEVILDKKVAQLPDELLSLLLEAPTLEAYSDEALALFPTPVRSYLLTWYLVFDAFKAAAFKVRSDYAENLKADNYVSPLMEFTFDVLGHSAAHALNLDKANFTMEQIQEYDLKLAETEPEERNMQWLLLHLYYLVLKFVPGLFKAWYLDCRSKQTKVAVQAWMVKYFSPIIILDALEDVSKWSESQEAPADDEKELIVKISKTAKEITAGYEVDESQATISIKVPPSYPLDGVSVVGVNRVAANERKWQSWVMTTQGVITFSGGNIIDGLSAFKRNILGALKGHTECAICYSIISTDKKMPDKRCSTCKNSFHRACLYKWFQTSNQNSCPLCRNPIDYLGADSQARRG